MGGRIIYYLFLRTYDCFFCGCSDLALSLRAPTAALFKESQAAVAAKQATTSEALKVDGLWGAFAAVAGANEGVVHASVRVVSSEERRAKEEGRKRKKEKKQEKKEVSLIAPI